MTTKLTLSIDDAVIEKAKVYAKQRGKSLSDIVENYLAGLTREEQSTESISPRILKLMGVIKLPEDFNYKNALQDSIVKKHSS